MLKAMRESDSIKPSIFAMSNPTKNGLFFTTFIMHSLFPHMFGHAEVHLYVLFVYFMTAECTAAEAFVHAGENIVFASGSPFENVDLSISHFY